MIEATIDLVSACYMFIIIIGIYYFIDRNVESTKAYIYCCWICFTGLIIDAISYIEWVHNDFFIGLVNFLSFVWLDILLAAYCYYLIVFIKERTGRFSGRMLWTLWGLCVLDFIFLTFAMLTGRLFVLENKQVIMGPWSDYAFAIPAVIMIVCIYYLFRNSKGLSFRNLIALSIYGLVAVLWFLDITIISGYVGFALCLTVIFVIIQFRTISEANMKAEIFNTLSVMDVLTGLNNRRAYEKCLADIPPETDVCAVFCDVNSLKTVNDTMGHEEGDKLIKKMADILRKVFSEKEIFRISGDEFVVILQNEEDGAASEKIAALKQIILENDRIASMGYDMGKGGDVQDVINDAEKMMYLEKTEYYKETGKDRRS